MGKYRRQSKGSGGEGGGGGSGRGKGTGAHASFEEVVQAEWRFVLRTARSQGVSRASAEDVAIDVFLRLSKHFQPMNTPSIRKWLRTTTLQLVAALGPLSDGSLDGPPEAANVIEQSLLAEGHSLNKTPEEALSSAQSWAILQECIEELPANLRDVLEGHLFAEESLGTIANRLETTESEVRLLLDEARAHLREKLLAKPERVIAPALLGGLSYWRRKASDPGTGSSLSGGPPLILGEQFGRTSMGGVANVGSAPMRGVGNVGSAPMRGGGNVGSAPMRGGGNVGSAPMRGVGNVGSAPMRGVGNVGSAPMRGVGNVGSAPMRGVGNVGSAPMRGARVLSMAIGGGTALFASVFLEPGTSAILETNVAAPDGFVWAPPPSSAFVKPLFVGAATLSDSASGAPSPTSSAAPPQLEGRAAWLMKLAESTLRSGDLAQAEQILQLYCTEYPNDPMAEEYRNAHATLTSMKQKASVNSSDQTSNEAPNVIESESTP